jgi:hypothetical protein
MTISKKFEKRAEKIERNERGFRDFIPFRAAVNAACGAAKSIYVMCPNSADSSLWLTFEDTSTLMIDNPDQSVFAGRFADCTGGWTEIEPHWIRVK